MKKHVIALLMVANGLFFFGCAEVPIIGRKQFNMIPDSTLNQMADEQYQQFLSENKLSDDSSATAMVKRIGSNIQKATEEYFRMKGEAGFLSSYDWEFNLVENEQVNAWAMPGGKVVVYTGLLKLADTEDELAVVVAHEIAHAVAKHGAERMSYQLASQLGGVALSVAIKDYSGQTQAIFEQAYGMTAQYALILPYSRKHEYEADRMGMIFMALAGYDPRIAESFWREMSARSEGAEVYEWLSTHPSDESRVQAIRRQMPEALNYYKRG
jgi:predicted Zn-dependent protease